MKLSARKYLDEALFVDIPEGCYAIHDPLNEGEISYWRRKDLGKNEVPDVNPWPLQTRTYGPRLYKSDPRLRGLSREEKKAFIRSWYLENVGGYLKAVVTTIAADPVAAGKRFAEWQLRCCLCSKKLTTKESKVIGIGPDCREGLPKEFVDNFFPDQVGSVHAKYLAGSS